MDSKDNNQAGIAVLGSGGLAALIGRLREDERESFWQSYRLLLTLPDDLERGINKSGEVSTG